MYIISNLHYYVHQYDNHYLLSISLRHIYSKKQQNKVQYLPSISKISCFKFSGYWIMLVTYIIVSIYITSIIK